MSKCYEKAKEISRYYGSELIEMVDGEMKELVNLCKRIEFERKVNEMNSDINFIKGGKWGEVYKNFILNDVSEEDLAEKIASVMICLGAIGNRYMLKEGAIEEKIKTFLNL